jgi:hypothetical protein
MAYDNKEAHRRRVQSGYRNRVQRRRDEVVAQFWHDQGGRCYLCEEPIAQEAAVLDHDHRCCPLDSFCAYCVRGLCHVACNLAIGKVRDDPDRMERIARNLRTVLADVDVRLTSKPVQAALEATA